MRSFLVVVLGALALLVAWHAGALYRWGHYHMRTIPELAQTPQILRGMPADRDAARREFAARVAARFKDGMPEAALVDALRREGFPDVDDHGTNFVQKKGPCLQNCLAHWSIGWTRDAKGRAVDISTSYEPIGIPFTLFGDLLAADPE
jgi:hypothetical protein